MIIKSEAPPIRVDENGTAYVGETRIGIELLVKAFLNGETPEQMVSEWDVLTLPEVYAVIAYYLNHPRDVHAYMQQQVVKAQVVYERIQTEHPEMLAFQERLRQIKRDS